MKPRIKTTGVAAAKWTVALSAAIILGPLFMGLAASVDISAETIAQKLLVALVSFPIIFVVIWICGIFTRKDITAGITPIAASTNGIPKTGDSNKRAGLWNYVWIGIGAFMLL